MTGSLGALGIVVLIVFAYACWANAYADTHGRPPASTIAYSRAVNEHIGEEDVKERQLRALNEAYDARIAAEIAACDRAALAREEARAYRLQIESGAIVYDERYGWASPSQHALARRLDAGWDADQRQQTADAAETAALWEHDRKRLA